MEELLCQLLNVHAIKYMRRAEMNTADPLVHGPCSSNDETATEKLILHKSPGTHQSPARLFQAEGNIWNTEELLQQWKKSVIVPTDKKCTNIVLSRSTLSYGRFKRTLFRMAEQRGPFEKFVDSPYYSE
jgi:hypothetical protein